MSHYIIMESKIIELDNMKKADLKKPSKSQVTKLLLKQNFEPERAVPKPRIKPIPTPRKNVKQMVQEFEDNIIPPPVEIRDGWKPTQKSKTEKDVVPVAAPRTKNGREK